MQSEPVFQSVSGVFSPSPWNTTEPCASADPLPDVPILLATRLQLELLLQHSVLDLRAISEVILEDPGATLQILRLIGEEYPIEDERPIRIEHCIASLNADLWFEVVSASTIIQSPRTLGAWDHARRIGLHAERLAGQQETLRPGEGQLVGLLHEVGTLPQLLGWQSDASGLQEGALGAILAEHWHLPSCVRAAIGVREEIEESSHWSRILAAAHLCAEQEDVRRSGRAAGRSGRQHLQTHERDAPKAAYGPEFPCEGSSLLPAPKLVRR